MSGLTELHPYLVTIRVFDTHDGAMSGHDYDLPVDSPDPEHAIASTLANAASFTAKTDDNGQPLPVGFCCVRLSRRNQ